MADFGPRSGAGIGSIIDKANGFWRNYGGAITIVTIIVFMIFTIWLLGAVYAVRSAVVKVEALSEMGKPVGGQIRETLASSTLSSAMAADPAAFCAGVNGDTTTSPWGYLNTTAHGGDLPAALTTSESLTGPELEAGLTLATGGY